MMFHRVHIVAVCFAAGCASGHTVMTMNSFHEIPIGSSSTQLVQQAGEPYAIHKKEDGSIEYEYIERIRISAIEWEVRHYFLMVKDGKVVAKRVEGISTPPTFYDSYDMQSTQSGQTNDGVE